MTVKEAITIISILIIIVFSLLFLSMSISNKAASAQNSTIVYNNGLMDEWISPDGVHYWYKPTIYGGVMSPRYDSNGELVID